jgi:citrate synthase
LPSRPASSSSASGSDLEPSSGGRTLSARQAADRLGIKVETLYASVSRGMLERLPDEGGRRGSRFDTRAVERLARGRRGRTRAGGIEMTLSSGITLIEDDRLCYRGLDAATLARTCSFESVAELLWGSGRAEWTTRRASGDAATAAPDARTWAAEPAALDAGRLAQRALPDGTHFADRIRLTLHAIAPTDALRYDVRLDSVCSAGRALIAGMVECLPDLGRPCDRTLTLADGAAVPVSIAERLWSRLTPEPARTGCLELLNAALVLVADHGLAASTFAARIAASVQADPYAVVATGLDVISGSLHGAASAPAHRILEEIGQAERAVPGVAEVLRREKRIPGFGHMIYSGWDPRAVVLLEMLRAADVDPERRATCEAVLDVLGQRAPVKPNVDFLLASIAFTTGMDAAAGEAIFAIARSAGWIAHALEEYDEMPVRFRPRAHYTGPPPTRRETKGRR